MYIIQIVANGGRGFSTTIAQLSDGVTPANVNVDFGELGFRSQSSAVEAAKGFYKADPMNKPPNNYHVLDYDTNKIVWSHPKNK